MYKNYTNLAFNYFDFDMYKKKYSVARPIELPGTKLIADQINSLVRL